MGQGIAVFDLCDALRRAAYVERGCLRQLAGWFLRAPAWEDKQRFGHDLWNHAEHVDWLRARLTNLRGGHPEASVEPALRQAIDQAIHAPGERAWIRGSYLVLKRELLNFYEGIVEQACPAANAFDLNLLGRIVPELKMQIAWAEERLGEAESDEESGWAASVSARLAAAGGITGTDKRPSLDADLASGLPFTMPDRMLFDDRISDDPLVPLADRQKMAYEDGLREQFRVFFNEIYAAGMLATILYEVDAHDLPWNFTRDFARHFWDECRHSEFGSLRLGELGTAPDRCDQTLLRYSMEMPMLHRICYLTMVLEPFYMPRKKPRFEEYASAGDARSQLFADHDWSDEANHVRFGKKWLDFLLEDDARDMRKVKEEIAGIIERITGKPVESLSPF